MLRHARLCALTASALLLVQARQAGREPPGEAASRPVRIACAGTDITWGAGVVHRELNAFPAQLQAMLGDSFEVRNFGSSGATVLATPDSEFVVHAEYREALRYQPDILFLEFGTHESRPENRNRLENFERDYLALIASFRELPAPPRIILLLPPPVFSGDTTGHADTVVTARIIPAIRSVAYSARCELIDLHMMFAGTPVYFADQIHPSSLGAGLIAARLFEAVRLDEDRGFDLSARAGLQGSWSNYQGYRCLDFTFEGRGAKIVRPWKTVRGAPWVWRARFWGHEPQTEIGLLERGYHIVFCDVAELFGNDQAVGIWNRFYAMLTGAGLLAKAALEGFSRGGVYIYRWAVQNPGRVACVYADAPVLDFKSWPGGKGKGHGNPEEWQRFKDDFGLKSEAEALAFRGNPLDLAPEIARAGFPLLHVCGDADVTVPLDENTDPFEKKILEQGGRITVIRKPGVGHHPHSLANPQPIVDFILRATGHKVNFACIPAPGGEYRESAGLRNGMEWHDLFAEMNGLGETLSGVDILFLGNSITQGIGGKGRSLASAPGDSAFRALFAGTSWVNFGIAGDRTQQILWRVTRGDWKKLHPRLIVLAAGVNNFPSDTGEEVAQGLRRIVEAIFQKDPDVKILLVGPLPAKDPLHMFRRKFQEVHALIAKLADGTRLFYTPLAFRMLAADGSLGTGLFAADGVHLSTQGYLRWAELLRKETARILE